MTRAKEKSQNPESQLRLCYENYECQEFDTFEAAEASEDFGRPVYLVCKLKGYGGLEETLDEMSCQTKPSEEMVDRFFQHCKAVASNKQNV